MQKFMMNILYITLVLYPVNVPLSMAQDFVVEESSPEATGEQIKTNESKERLADSANIVVTGTLTKKARKTAPVKTEVIDRSKIEAKGAVTLYDALNSELALLVENQCQNCEMNEVRLNGLSGNDTQILIDGLPTVTGLAGVYFLQQIPAEMIERIEIVRGAGSSLYGSGAIGGVINIISRKPMVNSGSVDVRYDIVAGNVDGSRDYAYIHTVSGYASVVDKTGKAGILLWGQKTQHDPWDANDDGYSDLALRDLRSMGGSAFVKLFDGMELNVNASTLHEYRRGGNELDLEPFNPAVNICEMTDNKRDSLNVKLEHVIDDTVNYTAYYGYASMKRHSYYGPAGNDILSEDTNLYGITENPFHLGGLVINLIPVKNHTFTFGIEHTSDKLTDSNPGMNRELDEHYKDYGVFGQYDWNTDFIELLVGLRGDRHSELDEWNYCPRASVIVKFTPTMRLRGVVATGFKAPQIFNEDFHIEISLGGTGTTNHLIVNSPDLDPERSISYSTDFSGEIKFGNLDIDYDIGGFYTEKKDTFYIDYDNPATIGNNTYYTRLNESGTSKYYGGNMELGLMFKSFLRFSSGMTVQKAEYGTEKNYDNGSFDEVEEVPSWYGYSMIQFFIKHLVITFATQYLGPQYVLYEGNTTELRKAESFIVLNTKVEYTIKSSQGFDTTLYAGIDNITDKYQHDLAKGQDRPSAYIYGPEKPFTVYAGMKIRI